MQTQTVDKIKKQTIEAAEKFLSNSLKFLQTKVPQVKFDIDGSVESLTGLMQQLNKVMDCKCGIIQHEIDGPAPLGQKSDDQSRIAIRDARGSNGIKPEDIPESWMEVMAGQARGVVSLLDMNESDKFNRRGIDETKTKKAIVKTFEGYCSKIESAKSAKERKKIVTEFNQELVEVLKSRGVIIGDEKLANMSDDKVIKIMGDARDFCNLGEKTQNHQVTIMRGLEQNQDFIWASMKVNPLSEEIKAEYQKVKYYAEQRDQVGIEQTPKWFQNLKPYQKELTIKYLDQIMDGNHTLPTQLRFLLGIKNAFIDVKGFVESGKISNEVYVEFHSGTLVHNAGSDNNNEARRVTELNMEHVKSLAGEERKVILSVLNTDSIFQPGERNICRIGKDIAGKIDGMEYHQNGVNIASLSPDVSLKRIEKLSVSINSQGQDEKILWTACKSGKDRTFALIMRNAAKVFGGEREAEFMKKLSDSSHAETMASGAGATRGAYGLKLKEMFYRIKDRLLGAVENKLTNTISGINTMHPTKLKRKLDYDKIYEDLAIADNKAVSQNKMTNFKNPSLDALATRKALMKKSDAATITPSPNAALGKKRSITL